ncbi:MAG: DUF4258 domain-containing protein [Chloroflexia bacterium]
MTNRQYGYSIHADEERNVEGLDVEQVRTALLTGQVLEQYPDTGRGLSCLVVGFAGAVPIHVVCGRRGSDIILITLYIPRPPKFVDPWTRGA